MPERADGVPQTGLQPGTPAPDAPAVIPAPVATAAVPHSADRGQAAVLLPRLGVALALAVATLAVLWPLGLTNRVLAGIDALTYFTPYWAYRMAELRAGQIPLWNPYLFLGVPFLANPQAAVLYPLHWPLSWLPSAGQALVWSALLHAWLACLGMYAFGRRSLGLSRLAALLAAVLFGLGGFTLARVENINQLNALAWLPALLWLLDETAAAGRRGLRWGVALALVMALALLAGHTQTTFIDFAGLGLYAIWPIVTDVVAHRVRLDRRAAQARLLPLLALAPAALLCAAQLLPTLELNGLGLRTGGLPFRQAVSFSLRPRLLAQSLLPGFGGGLAEAFGSEGYGEFVGYLGLAALVLAGLGALRTLRRADNSELAGRRGARAGLLALAAAGFLLALGVYDPLYYLLWRFVPGFALFRAPARWLALYALGMAGLAGVGLDGLVSAGGVAAFRLRSVSRRWRSAAMLAGLAVLALLVFQQWPARRTLAGWLAALVSAAALLWLSRRRPSGARFARAGFVALALAELWLGARSLPFAQATTPAATALRNAPATLLAATADQPPAGRDRFLSMSDIRFDPGDLAQLRSLQAGALPSAAVERYVRAAKQMEVLAPNLPLLLRLPAVDGYDGGVLPLDRYVKLQTLFLPPDRLLPDGRLREQLRTVPDARLLDLTDTRFVITDKQNDLWAGDVYYDLEQAVTLQPGQSLTLDLAGYPRFSATAAGVVSYLAADAPAGSAVGEITLSDGRGGAATLTLSAGHDTAWAQAPQAAGVTVARPWPDWQGQGRDYLALKDFPATACTKPGASAAALCPLAPTSITLRALPAAGAGLVVRGLSLIDRRTAAHESVTLSPLGDFRRIESGDVKVYARSAPGRAWIVHRVTPAADDAAALAALRDPGFDPRQIATVTGKAQLPDMGAAPAAGADRVTVTAYEPERIELSVDAASAGLLVLDDAAYPGWQARIDGQPASVLTADYMLRGVALPAGRHTVTFAYQSGVWQRGVWISLGTLAVLVLAAFVKFPAD